MQVSGLGREEVTVNISAHIDMPGVQWFNTELVSWVTSIPVSTLPKDRGKKLSIRLLSYEICVINIRHWALMYFILSHNRA